MFVPYEDKLVLSNRGPNTITFTVQMEKSLCVQSSFFFSVFPNSGQILPSKSETLILRLVGFAKEDFSNLITIIWEESETKNREIFYIPFSVTLEGEIQSLERQNNNHEQPKKKIITDPEKPLRFWEINPKDLTWGKTLGRGASAEVKQGTLMGTQVAIKNWAYGTLDDPPIDFERELSIYTQVHHPNLVTFIGAITSVPGNSSLVTEFLEFGSLDSLLSNSDFKISWADKIKIAAQIVNGMEHLHSKGKIHRDLKSLNVLIDEQLNAKVHPILDESKLIFHFGGDIGR